LSLDDIPKIIQSNYSSELTNNSRKHNHLNCQLLDYYYEAFQINVNISDYYIFISNSNFHAHVYLFKHKFDPINPKQNLYTLKHSFLNNNEFKVTAYLEFDITYVLIMTTSPNYKNEQGLFTIIGYGSDKIDMKHIGSYIFGFSSTKYCIVVSF